MSSPASHRAAHLVSAIWASSLAGTSQLRVSTTPTHYELLVSPSGRQASSTSSRRELAACVFDRALRGERQKFAALSLGLSPATISQMLSEVALDMELHARFSRLPAAVALLAHVARYPSRVTLEVEGDLSWQQAPQRLVRVSRCQVLLGEALTRSERDVAWHFLEASSYAQIAQRRQTSVRTVANQIARVFRAFDVTGRFELLRALIERNAVAPLASRITVQVVRSFDGNGGG